MTSGNHFYFPLYRIVLCYDRILVEFFKNRKGQQQSVPILNVSKTYVIWWTIKLALCKVFIKAKHFGHWHSCAMVPQIKCQTSNPLLNLIQTQQTLNIGFFGDPFQFSSRGLSLKIFSWSQTVWLHEKIFNTFPPRALAFPLLIINTHFQAATSGFNLPPRQYFHHQTHSYLKLQEKTLFVAV